MARHKRPRVVKPEGHTKGSNAYGSDGLDTPSRNASLDQSIKGHQPTPEHYKSVNTPTGEFAHLSSTATPTRKRGRISLRTKTRNSNSKKRY